jgi:site-specific DNA recombinase
VRAIPTNPKYTGRQVWNRQRRDEVLVDVDDVASGHRSKLRWNDKSDWIWSTDESHEPLVTAEDYTRVQEQLAVGRNRPAVRKARSTPRPYLLRGLLVCGICGRRMGGQHNHDEAYYRCRYPTEYALTDDVDHPRTVYLHERYLIPELDRWLARIFDPDHLDQTCAELAAASGSDEVDDAARQAALRKLEDCNTRLERYRAALDSGTDPAVVGQWIAEVQGDRLRAQQALTAATRDALNVDQVRAVINGLGPIEDVLEAADPLAKAALYAGLGLQLTYRPAQDLVAVEAVPVVCAKVRVGGGT